MTSGCPAPTLGTQQNVAMAYLPANLARVGTKVELEVRKKVIEAEVVKMPFVPSKYYFGG